MLRFQTFAAALAALVLADNSHANDCVFQDQGGLVVIEMESGAIAPGWIEATSFLGFAGSSYYRWTGPNHFNSPGNGIIAFDFNVQQGGTWQLSLRNRHQDPDSSMENDVWVRVDGGGWDKVYSNQGAASVNAWNWFSKFDLTPQAHTLALYTLTPGDHTIEFSGRSKGFMIDRIHIHKQGNSDKFNESVFESPCGGNGPVLYCQGKASSSGCVAQMTTSDLNAMPVSGANDYTITVEHAEGQRPGLLFSSISGQASIPFQGGTLCMNPPLVRGPVMFTGGTPGSCNGTFSISMANNGATLPFGFDAGTGVRSAVQAWIRDGQLPGGSGTTLSNAVLLDWQ